jgi:hypothetical protein
MIGYLFHTTDGRWLLYLEDGTFLKGKTRKAVVKWDQHRRCATVREIPAFRLNTV